MDGPAPATAETWSSGENYEPYVGRWSRLVAREFVAWLDLPPGLRWLDVGCGTGALSAAVLAQASPAHVLGLDPSAAYVEYARRSIADRTADFEVGDAEDLPAVDEPYDVAVSGLVLNFLPDRLEALRGTRRVVRDHGVVAAYVWDYPGEMWQIKHFWDAAVEVDAAALDLHQSKRFSFCRPPELEQLFADAGLAEVSSRAIVVATVFDSFDDYWIPFLGGQGAAPSYLRGLDESHQTAIRERVRARMPVAPDGSIPLTARAWAVRGRA